MSKLLAGFLGNLSSGYVIVGLSSEYKRVNHVRIPIHFNHDCLKKSETLPKKFLKIQSQPSATLIRVYSNQLSFDLFLFLKPVLDVGSNLDIFEPSFGTF